jgi:hypothetical protein
MADASGTIWRGTTPTVTVTLPLDLTGWARVVLSIHGQGAALDLEGDRLTIAKVDGGCTIAATLTQVETLSFREFSSVRVQVRARDASGQAIDTTIGGLEVGSIVMDGEV